MRFALTLFSALLFSFCYAQNVGIGITTPAAPLHIRNTGSELLRLQGNDPYLSFFNNSGVAKGFLQGHGDNLNLGTIAGNTNGYIQFFNNNNLNMVIHPNSNVGIGTNGPNFKLTVQTANDNYGLIHRSDNIIVGSWIGNNGGTIGGWYGTYTNHPLMFFTNNAGPQITLLQNGNVGIGYTDPMSKLDINGTLLASSNIGIGTTTPVGRLHINGSGNAINLQGTSHYIYFCDAFNVGKGFLWNKGGNNMDLGTEVGNNSGEVKLTIRGIEPFTVQSDARVRVGPNASIHNISGFGMPNFTVNGILAIKLLTSPFYEWTIFPSLNDLNFYKNGNQLAYIDNDGDWNSVSDASLKENVKIFRAVLPHLTNLKVSTYQYKSNHNGDVSFGLIAQNVKEYFPEIVSENIDKDGKRLLAISYAKTGVLAIKAIQEQQEIIETQQKRIDELERRLLKLENRPK